MVLTPGPTSFTEARLHEIWDEGSKNADDFRRHYPQSRSKNCYCRDYRVTTKGKIRSEKSRQRYINQFLRRWVQWAVDPATAFHRIDGEFSSLFAMNYQAWEWVGNEWRLSERPSEVNETSTVGKASRVLQRLPPTPPKIDLSLATWSQPRMNSGLHRYFNEGYDSQAIQRERFSASPWIELQTVTKFSTATLRIALLLAMTKESRFDIVSIIRRYLDLTSELISSLDLTSRQCAAQNRRVETEIVRTYLWTAWNRILMLLFWYILGEQLNSGFDDKWNEILAVRGMPLLTHPSIRATLYGWDDRSSPYMCRWAFELLRTHRASIGLDFRDFHQRFAELHGNKPQRCSFEGNSPCNGAHPLDCGRFQDKRLVLKEQSIHYGHEGACEKVTWDESSYLSVSGPTAVSLALKSGRAQYTNATGRTMAISHVWSHGRGGRPHEGMNRCLHDQFVFLAELNQCDSYWIDTLCIPEEHNERKIAIGYINRIFSGSKIILVLDRDLMDIDVSILDLKLLESLLATFLVCDWNVRAWTMLEATRGCHGLYLLCKHNRTVSLRRALTDLHKHGSVSISILFLASQHLLPASLIPNDRVNGLRPLEYAASLLSHRHATRRDDDIVIWSIMSNRPACFNAKEFWQGRINRKVKTAFLMSNAPRLQGLRGFSWAPATPYIRRPDSGETQEPLGPYLVYDGAGSEEGIVTPSGLQADWLIHRVNPRDDLIYRDAPATMTSFTPDGRKETLPLGQHRILNRCWQYALSLLEDHAFVLLIQPKGLRSDLIYRSSSDRGESHGQVFAICVSNDDARWRWMGVRNWPQDIALPKLEQEDLLIT